MDRDLKRYFKQRQHGGRGRAARAADGIALRLVFAAACYLWFRYNVANQIVVILLTAATTLLFLAAARLYRELSFDRFVKKEQERLMDVVLRERLLLLSEDAFSQLCRNICEQLPGFDNNTFIWCAQRATNLDEDTILQAYHAAQAQSNPQLAICSLSPCNETAAALLLRLPIHAECVNPELLLHMARQTEGYTVDASDVEAHIRSGLAAKRDSRARMQGEPFAAGRSRKYLLCAGVLILASFLTGYALYYRLLAGLCLLLAATTFALNRSVPVSVTEQ